MNIAICLIALLGGPTTSPSTQPAKPINEYCAIDREEKINPKVTYTYNGQVIGFCCNDCIPIFKKNPEKHMQGLK